MPEGVAYTGCDPNADYIQHARERYSTAGRFLCLSAEDFELHRLGEFDVVLVVSVLHHLDDIQVRAFAAGARAVLRTGGVLLVWEPCWTPSQGLVDRLMLSIDRGRFVRTAEAYSALLERNFESIQTRFLMTPKMLWPQSGCILRARASSAE
jgi:SAM-dependent methyltransferase